MKLVEMEMEMMGCRCSGDSQLFKGRRLTGVSDRQATRTYDREEG